MITTLKQQIDNHSGSETEKYNHLRELLQLLILKKIDESGYFQKIAFVGGTALRIVYDLKRFSEDLDFSLTNSVNFNFQSFIEKLAQELQYESLVIEYKTKTTPAVCSAQLKFKNILFETNLSTHKDAIIMIKIEIDCNPPEGYITELSLITKGDLINIHHFDLPSLFAGKLHALLHRKYTKGRDYYDFLWYCGRNVKPNLSMLHHALAQTGEITQNIDYSVLKKLLATYFEKADYEVVKKDLEMFLTDPKELRLLTKDTFLNALQKLHWEAL